MPTERSPATGAVAAGASPAPAAGRPAGRASAVIPPLEPGDPEQLGVWRLLGRLGAGGMGVVYLARNTGGRTVAIKAVRLGRTADATYRARFRREVAAARRVDPAYGVPVLDADPDAATPWLATAFIPGPSLHEAVAAYGRLPEPAVRGLGARLARGIAGMHALGIVHRDIKPANVLLSLDGPRLIDFGIAWDEHDSYLTTDGHVVGTPGYLAPEQVQGEGSGPQVDVFALAATLVYAATGRPAFGGGSPPQLLYRVVHEPARLDDVPADLRGILAAGLAKEPEERPTAAEFTAALAAGAEAPVDAWMPAPVTRIIARRSAELLDWEAVSDASDDRAGADPDRGTPDGRSPSGAADRIDAPDATTVVAGVPDALAAAGLGSSDSGPSDSGPSGSGPPDSASSAREESAPERPAPAQTPDAPSPAPARTPSAPDTPAPPAPPERRPSRRTVLAATAAVVLTGGGIGAWFATRGGTGHPQAPGLGAAPPTKRLVRIGLHADFSGPHAAIGRAHEQGARLALARQSALPVAVELVPADDHGNADTAADAARGLVADPSVIAVLGPCDSASVTAAADIYNAASLTALTVAVSDEDLTVDRRTAFLRAVPGYADLGVALATDLVAAYPGGRIAVIGDPPRFGWDVSRAVYHSLANNRMQPRRDIVTAQFPAADALAATEAFAPAALVVCGERALAVDLARRIRERPTWPASIRTYFVDQDPIGGDAFIREGGAAVHRWMLVTPVLVPAAPPIEQAAAEPGLDAFTAEFRQVYGQDPPPYAAEAYDATTLICAALARPDVRDRRAMVTALRDTRHQGVARKLVFDPATGDYLGNGIGLYQILSGHLTYLGRLGT